MTIKEGDKEILFIDSLESPSIIEITYTEINANGAHKAKSNGFEFTRIPAGDTPSSYVVFQSGNKTWEALTRKRGVKTAPNWLEQFNYYAFCKTHNAFYRTDGTLSCVSCYSDKMKSQPKNIASSWG